MAYLQLIALAPGLLFFWHLLGLFGTDPSKLHGMFLILKGFRRDPRWHCGSQFSIEDTAPAMGGRIEPSPDRYRAGWSCARPLPFHSGKLSHDTAGFAGCDLLFSGLDHPDKTLPILCCEV